MKHAADAVHVCRLQMKTWVKKKKKTDTERRVCAGHGKALRKPEVWGGRQASRGGRDRTRRRMECQFVCMEAHKLCQKKVGVCAHVCVCACVLSFQEMSCCLSKRFSVKAIHRLLPAPPPLLYPASLVPTPPTPQPLMPGARLPPHLSRADVTQLPSTSSPRKLHHHHQEPPPP